jgi:imidazolonepropionase-like amidohydrolase
MTQILLDNARIFDGLNADCPAGMAVLIEQDRIVEVSDRPIAAPDARRIDVGGRTLMPGLIDLHIHAYASDVDFQKVDRAGAAYRTAHATRMLGHALDCGFTTVRDIGGGDYSLALALSEGLIRGPRFFYAGKVLSMTGGHGDFRLPGQHRHPESYCGCGGANVLCVMADGVDQCIKAAREELRQGAHCLKIMSSGGVASPSDPIWMNQYREDETRAIVHECNERRTYVSAHCHPASAVRRSVEFGVRVIEHGTLIDAETAAFVAERGAYIVPTMATILGLIELGKEVGFPAVSMEKMAVAAKSAISGMDLMRTAGVKLGFGTDLLGSLYNRQCTEFTYRREVFTPLEMLRQATSMSAEILQRSGELGCIAAGAFADMIVVDGDPLSDIGLLERNGAALSVIVRGGELVKNRL